MRLDEDDYSQITKYKEELRLTESSAIYGYAHPSCMSENQLEVMLRKRLERKVKRERNKDKKKAEEKRLREIDLAMKMKKELALLHVKDFKHGGVFFLCIVFCIVLM